MTIKTLNIAPIDYTLSLRSVDIYVSGCKLPHCHECHNPELWEFSSGTPYSKKTLETVGSYISDFPRLVKKIMILGGEPMDQNIDALTEMLKDLKHFKKEIWLFTRNVIDEIPSSIKKYCDYIKTGKYICTQYTANNTQYGIKLASDNQTILKKGVDFHAN